MTKNKPELSTSINLVLCIYSLLFLYPLQVFIRTSIEPYSYRLVFNIFSLIVLYFILHYLVSRLKIYSDRIEIVYIFRIFSRVKVIQFSNIVQVRYIYHTHTYATPTIQILEKGFKTKLDLPSNSFPVYVFKKRGKILLFFKMKGIPIEIVSEREKDLSILENLPD
jgi:hypothetical protein